MTGGTDNQPYLRVTEGRARGLDLLVPHELILGRAAETIEARLGDDPELSRRHARVTRAENGSLTIEDLGSTNGTYVNDEQISAPRPLRPGDRLWLGTTTLEVRATPPGEMPARWASRAPAAAPGAPAPARAPAAARGAAGAPPGTAGAPPGVAGAPPGAAGAPPGAAGARPGTPAGAPERARAETRSFSVIAGISIDPAPITVSRWVVLVVLALGTFVTVLDTSIVTVALPDISSHLHASLSDILWIVNAYVLTFAVLLITFGRLGEMVGPKRLFIGGLGIFVTASLVCGLSDSTTLLIVARVVQGIGAAMLLPQTLALITFMFPPEERGQAVGVWGAVAGLAVVAGPLLGGVLTEDVSWRAIFFLNVPIGLIGMIAAFLLVPSVRTRERHSLDIVGVVLVGAGLAAITYGLVEGETYNWGRISSTLKFNVIGLHGSLWSIPTVLLYGVVLLVAFFFWERRQSEPLLPLKLFADRNFSIGSFSQGAVNFTVLGLFLSLTIFLQSVLGFSAIKTGIAFLPLAAGIIVGSGIGGALVDKRNGKWVLPFGLLLIAVGLVYTIAAVSPNGKFIDTVPPFVIFGLGMGLSYTSVTTLAVRDINPADGGPASGFIETSGQLGASAGSAIVGAILLVRLASAEKTEAVKFSAQLPSQARGQFVQSYSHAATSVLNVGSSASTSSHPASTTAAKTARAGLEVFQHAYVTAMRGTLIVPLAVAVVTMLIAIWIKSPKYVHRSRTVSESGVFSFPMA
jgi:EmrB/QacA subfamily drug resistance transporter